MAFIIQLIQKYNHRHNNLHKTGEHLKQVVSVLTKKDVFFLILSTKPSQVVMGSEFK